MDLEIRLLDRRLLARLAKCMAIEDRLDEWQSTCAARQSTPDVKDSQAGNRRLGRERNAVR